ncbi:SH3 domain-containing protein [Mycena sanguinolenta]|uniref:SH3 domain-containing protein n=1 Tax=Mycena sanguinolenta TaxID=230812 RepID=A0A8H6YMR3_9AGAR|nr:SH3 domain-containing protein [Mycena sanguinolenta]
MSTHPQRRSAERARHGKRLPFQGGPDDAPQARQNNDVFSLTGPITLTQIIPITTSSSLVTTTSANPQSTLGAPSPPSPPAIPPATSQTAPANPATITPPSAVASAINPTTTTSSSGTENAQVNSGVSVPSQHGLPTGAIVGITIACVILILGAFVFFIRQRALRNRNTRRQTQSQWMGGTSYSPAKTMAESSPGASFARAQQAALARPAVPAAVVPVPPAAYNTGAAPAPSVTSAGGAPAMVRYEFLPSLPDELSITTGEVVSVISEYDDGWAFCKNARGDQGMVPLECLERSAAPQTLQPDASQDYRNSRRTSSLRPGF